MHLMIFILQGGTLNKNHNNIVFRRNILYLYAK